MTPAATREALVCAAILAGANRNGPSERHGSPLRRRKRRARALTRAIYEGRPLSVEQRRQAMRWLEFVALQPGDRGRVARRIITWLIETGTPAAQ
jgi:hypothetical protein